MLITMLKALTQPKLDTTLPTNAVRGSLAEVIDLSGPLPEAETLPYLENPVVGTPRKTVWRRDTTEMSLLPPELDPFECDWPWVGWTDPRHEAVVGSHLRSATFEEDMRRVQEIFRQ